MAPRAKSEKLAQTLDTNTEAGKQTVENVVKLSTETAARNYEKALAATQEHLEKATSAAFASYDELTTLGKSNLDAVVKASTVLVKGLESLGKEVASYGQASLEKSVSNTQALFTVKTLRELVELQSDFAKQAFDSWMEQGTRLGEIGVKVVSDAFEPIQEQVSVTVEKILKPIAA
ncbi:MAG TPA: phasin family protein [Alphaproteobacteria bacterium]|nr:phasin family protein [Alphaproteobacteria bacterium]